MLGFCITIFELKNTKQFNCDLNSKINHSQISIFYSGFLKKSSVLASVLASVLKFVVLQTHYNYCL